MSVILGIRLSGDQRFAAYCEDILVNLGLTTKDARIPPCPFDMVPVCAFEELDRDQRARLFWQLEHQIVVADIHVGDATTGRIRVERSTLLVDIDGVEAVHRHISGVSKSCVPVSHIADTPAMPLMELGVCSVGRVAMRVAELTPPPFRCAATGLVLIDQGDGANPWGNFDEIEFQTPQKACAAA